MKYGIKTPDTPHRKSYIWWIAEDESRAWSSFFQYPNKNGNFNPHRAPLEEAIKAYKSIGYKCVEIEIIEKETIEYCPECGNKLVFYNFDAICECGYVRCLK